MGDCFKKEEKIGENRENMPGVGVTRRARRYAEGAEIPGVMAVSRRTLAAAILSSYKEEALLNN